jgi:hypothetical protein
LRQPFSKIEASASAGMGSLSAVLESRREGVGCRLTVFGRAWNASSGV